MISLWRRTEILGGRGWEWRRAHLQEKAELLETQVSDLTAQLQATKERNAVLQHQISAPAAPQLLGEALADPQTVTELHARCQVCTVR